MVYKFVYKLVIVDNMIVNIVDSKILGSWLDRQVVWEEDEGVEVLVELLDELVLVYSSQGCSLDNRCLGSRRYMI